MANIQEVLQTHLENVKSKVAQAMTDNQRNAVCGLADRGRKWQRRYAVW